MNGIFSLPKGDDISASHSADLEINRGYHYINYGAAGIPSLTQTSNGVLLVYNRYSMICQVLFSDNKLAYFRWSNGEATGSNWNDWVRIDNFGCNTLAELKAALAEI